jgi:hypothetical protein
LVFDDLHRLLRQLDLLSPCQDRPCHAPQLGSTILTRGCFMPNDLIRLVAKAQGLALSARLPAPLALRLRALAGWLFQPITRRRLVAITAGSLQPGFQFAHLGFQLADFAFQGQQQLNYYFRFPAAQLNQLFSSAHSLTLVSFPFCATSCSSFVQLLSKYTISLATLEATLTV